MPSFVEIGGGAHFCVLSWHGMSHVCCTVYILLYRSRNYAPKFPAGNFVAQPENVTVSSGQMGTFTCKVGRNGLTGVYWLITTERLQPIQLQEFYQANSSVPSEGMNDQQTSSIALQMIGTSETNNTSVECIAYYSNPEYILSDKVYLRVQGKLCV